MPRSFLPLALLLAAAALGAEPAPSAPYPPFTLPHTEVRDLPFKAPERQYQIQVGLPASYATKSQQRYPVIFVTDGYWDFPLICCTLGNFVHDEVAPECIVVGLGYAGENLTYGQLRDWDLTPAPIARAPDRSGHAAEFLALLENEIIPLVERDYRIDPRHRILAGSSNGGLFTLYTMLTRPELFSGYIAVSPAVNSADEWLFDYEKRIAKSGRPIKARLYLSGAELEWPSFVDAIKRFALRLDSRKYAGLRCSFDLIVGERHAGTKAEGYARGLHHVLAPLAPESGVMVD